MNSPTPAVASRRRRATGGAFSGAGTFGATFFLPAAVRVEGLAAVLATGLLVAAAAFATGLVGRFTGAFAWGDVGFFLALPGVLLTGFAVVLFAPAAVLAAGRLAGLERAAVAGRLAPVRAGARLGEALAPRAAGAFFAGLAFGADFFGWLFFGAAFLTAVVFWAAFLAGAFTAAFLTGFAGAFVADFFAAGFFAAGFFAVSLVFATFFTGAFLDGAFAAVLAFGFGPAAFVGDFTFALLLPVALAMSSASAFYYPGACGSGGRFLPLVWAAASGKTYQNSLLLANCFTTFCGPFAHPSGTGFCC